MKKIHIKKCQSPMLWYAAMVGEKVDFVCEDSEGYWSREPAGYLNVIFKGDAEVVEVRSLIDPNEKMPRFYETVELYLKNGKSIITHAIFVREGIDSSFKNEKNETLAFVKNTKDSLEFYIRKEIVGWSEMTRTNTA